MGPPIIIVNQPPDSCVAYEGELPCSTSRHLCTSTSTYCTHRYGQACTPAVQWADEKTLRCSFVLPPCGRLFRVWSPTIGQRLLSQTHSLLPPSVHHSSRPPIPTFLLSSPVSPHPPYPSFPSFFLLLATPAAPASSVPFYRSPFYLVQPVMSRQPSRPQVTPPTLTRRNEYFLPRNGIDREVISADICRYLGNDALVRPGRCEVRLIPWQG